MRVMLALCPRQAELAVPGAQLYPFQGYGHVPLFTATREFCDVLRRFVRTGTA